jgi:uncharacterized protein YdeI (YjbR/CyaY-like superfamily)
MKLGETFYSKDRESWHNWLVKNSKAKKEIWLIYYKKSSGKPRISYNDAVDEALCFGWIDSTAKSIDSEKFAQRFTPRRKTSVLSEMNRERVRRMINQKRMTAQGLEAISHAFNHLEDKKIVFRIRKDILSAIKKNKAAWEHFLKLPEGYRRVRIGYIESQRAHNNTAFRKSLNNFIRMTEKNKRFGQIRD